MTAHETATLAADLVLVDDRDRVLLIRRGKEPHLGAWALPGGRVDEGETFRQAAIREAKEETGLDLTETRLVTVGTYGDPGRDPRGRVVSTVFAARIDGSADVTAGSDADVIAWLEVDDAFSRYLAFDHERIIGDALERLDEYAGLYAAEKGFWASLRYTFHAGAEALTQINRNRKVDR
jgi:8-oxo-dGTP diphosphatase